MKLIDEAAITVQAGAGGRGCVSFRREKFIPRGGPDGGDGGKGGDVVFISTSRKRTLAQFQFKREFQAKNGAHGQGKRKTGKNGKDLHIHIPPGTVVRETDSGQIITDFNQADMRVVIARGGRGGQGNARFKSSTHRTPRFAQPGEPGEGKQLALTLKLLADVGIIGLPNAGKSTLITAISAARPKIDNYPFTTLWPHLGVAYPHQGEPFVVADIPGLIEGAHQGAGLGLQFLKHIERTRILIHLIDVTTIDEENPLCAYETVNRELSLHNKKLRQKPQLVVLNKLDIAGSDQARKRFAEKMQVDVVLAISAKTHQGVDLLMERIVQLLQSL